MKTFFHRSDLDGRCSGAIIKQTYPECEMIGVDYDNNLDEFIDEIQENEQVFVVDFCFEPHEDMIRLNERARLTWIDHHKTSVKWAADQNFIPTNGHRLQIGKGACELTWEFLYPARPIPNFIRYLSMHDIWDHTNPDTLPFQYGMRFQNNTWPDADIWTHLFGNWNNYLSKVPETITIGKTILKYETQQNAMYAEGMAYEAKFEGYRAIVMNKAYANSKAFDAVYDPDKHDIMILFSIKSKKVESKLLRLFFKLFKIIPKKIKYTLYCDKPEIDVSRIALKYGGGGHRPAAGFYSDKLLV